MKMDNEYNGWTNFATWKVMLEIFDQVELEVCADFCEDHATECALNGVEEGSLAEGFIRGFLADVNWHEISEAVNERIENE